MGPVEICMGRLYIAEAPQVLSTSGIGSCVAVCLWSQQAKKGSLAHIMLPKRPEGLGVITENDFRYADISIRVMVEQLARKGVPQNQIVAKIVGGAEMFPGIQARSQKVGQKNVEAVKEILSELSIPIAASETGGNSGRAIVFDISNGIVTIKMTI